MKLAMHHSLALAILVSGISFNALAGSSPGEVDFGKLAAPGKGGEFVEVQVSSNLLSLAAQFLDKQQPDIARLIRSVQLIHVNVVGISDENRDELNKRVGQIRTELAAKGWERNVNVKQQSGEDVGVYTKTRGGQALAGLAIIVVEPQQVVLVNIVGDIHPDQVAALGESLNIKPLKEVGEALKK